MLRITTSALLASLLALGCSSDTSGQPGPNPDMEDPKPDPDPDPDPEPVLRGPDNPPTLGAQIDRVGRAAISTALIETFNGDSTEKGRIKDSYNAAGPEMWPSFRDNMMASLAILDALDATCGNQLIADLGEERYGFLASVLADDQLYVNTGSGTCGVYLGLEAEIVGAIPGGAGGCGGRTLSDDVVERSYSVLAAGILAGVDDGIAGNDREFSTEFPFLAPPHL